MTNILDGKWVFDSNILIYGFDEESKFHQETLELFAKVADGKIQAVIAQQNIAETIQALVRGYKKSVKSVLTHLSGLISDFEISIITSLPKTYDRFFLLLSRSESPIDVFDYYLAATMLDNGINRILTVNTKDFEKIKEIEAVNPFSR